MEGVIPVRTHIITDEDDISEVIFRYTKNIADKRDIIAVCESVVAISQGLYYKPEDIKPRPLAKLLSNFTERHGSLTNPASMEIVFRKSGFLKPTLGAVIGGLGKLIGRRGYFFRITGIQAALIDDVAGTMPPFDRYIIAGPKDPYATAKKISERTGVGTVIVDANDLGKVDIIGASKEVKEKSNFKQIEKILENNPFGNDDEGTPLVVIKGFFKK
ncbi:coenzyme F420-0:L-glutamate ligase [Natranaerobius thermophilus]|uniref:Coenzyme F420:L-glutamate ligase-like domain-containing protein n=1 Tax=Natranaerobius thermophilus (strain ATCC BAA-1301 / DSM 18059 / JW/NM-WN-LF) TaxID=457570 RepID=B2A8A6_NATTJ|nr:coenzyme F420-0:L-glutamate ligase [Natranaerobius thermophilus]ACB84472.1 conserved hypothetical protein [Natranaerobius thermophilus JW/NM-WN-LF]